MTILGLWSSGMILLSGRRGPEFDSRQSPEGFFFFFCAWEEGTAIKAFQAMVKAKRKARSHVRSHAKESDARMAQPSTPLDHCAQAVALAAGLHESNELVGAVAEACSLNQFSVKDWAARWRRSDSHGDRARKHGLDVTVAASTVMAAAGSLHPPAHPPLTPLLPPPPPRPAPWRRRCWLLCAS